MKINKKSIILTIIVLVIILIVLTITLILLNKKEGNEKKVDGTIYMGSDGKVKVAQENLDVKYDQKELREPTEFFSVEQCIKNNYDRNIKVYKMNYLQGKNSITYSVYGTVEIKATKELEDKFLEVRVDLNNMTFEITDLSNENYTDLDQIILEDNETEIKNNYNNIFEYVAVNNEEMCKKYLEDFKQKELNNPQDAYSMLDEEFKKQNFPTFEKYQEYINENKIEIEKAEVVRYNVDRDDEYTEYSIIDNYNNTYIIKTTGIWDYTITIYSY